MYHTVWSILHVMQYIERVLSLGKSKLHSSFFKSCCFIMLWLINEAIREAYHFFIIFYLSLSTCKNWNPTQFDLIKILWLECKLNQISNLLYQSRSSLTSALSMSNWEGQTALFWRNKSLLYSYYSQKTKKVPQN